MGMTSTGRQADDGMVTISFDLMFALCVPVCI